MYLVGVYIYICNHIDLAYRNNRNISFERETYTKEKDLGYLKRRSFWEFFEI